MNINGNEILKYAIMVNGKKLAERNSAIEAEAFIATLTESSKMDANIIQITSDGKQLLLG